MKHCKGSRKKRSFYSQADCEGCPPPLTVRVLWFFQNKLTYFIERRKIRPKFSNFHIFTRPFFTTLLTNLLCFIFLLCFSVFYIPKSALICLFSISTITTPLVCSNGDLHLLQLMFSVGLSWEIYVRVICFQWTDLFAPDYLCKEQKSCKLTKAFWFHLAFGR